MQRSFTSLALVLTALSLVATPGKLARADYAPVCLHWESASLRQGARSTPMCEYQGSTENGPRPTIPFRTTATTWLVSAGTRNPVRILLHSLRRGLSFLPLNFRLTDLSSHLFPTVLKGVRVIRPMPAALLVCGRAFGGGCASEEPSRPSEACRSA